jgi:serine phosphatase RsbU (regulator of sigma subunit)
MSKSKILVVEDHPASLKMLSLMLGKAYDVMAASSGQAALFMAQEKRPDLVLLDIEMPGLDGFQTLDALKNGIMDQAVPVIFLTAREDSKSREKGLEAGAVDYITKPYDKQELSIKVKNHLALYEARKEIEARNRTMAKEMEMASQLQKSLLPSQFPKSKDVVFSVVYRPVSDAGGDFYDVIELPDQSIGFALVDVCGHGISAAMIGAMFKMAFQSFARNSLSPDSLLSTINDELFRILPESDFLTVFYGIINTETFEMIYTNAGHPRPFLHRCATGETLELGAGGPLLGAFPSMAYDAERVQLQHGDRILIFTDGVTEATKFNGPTGAFFGEERLLELFVKSFGNKDSVLQNIMEQIQIFRGCESFDDDITLLMASIG